MTTTTWIYDRAQLKEPQSVTIESGRPSIMLGQVIEGGQNRGDRISAARLLSSGGLREMVETRVKEEALKKVKEGYFVIELRSTWDPKP
jgi:hypothetical protein